MNVDIKDNGWLSRKLALTAFAMVLAAVVALLSQKFTGLLAIYSTFCSTITGLTALYIGGNAAVKHILTKNLVKEDNSQDVTQGK